MTRYESATFAGVVDVCLPSALNGAVASDIQRSALLALEPREFDQQVFRYCGRDVADFLKATVRLQLRGMATCAMPVRCECTTQGATRASPGCQSTCTEVDCDDSNCPAVLWQDSKLDAVAACACSRSSACGLVAPSDGSPGICRAGET